MNLHKLGWGHTISFSTHRPGGRSIYPGGAGGGWGVDHWYTRASGSPGARTASETGSFPI